MPRSLRRHAAALALGLVVVSASVGLAASASVPPPTDAVAAERVPTAGTLEARPAHGAPGTAVTLTGVARPRQAHRVKLQRLEGFRWVTAQSATTRRTGAFRFAVTLPAGLASVTYRVVTPRASGVRPSRTPAVTLRVDLPDVETGARLLTGDDALEHVVGVVSGDGRFVLDGRRGTVAVRDLATGEVTESPIAGHAIDISDDGTAVLLAAASGLPMVWFPATRETWLAADRFQGGTPWSISGDGGTILVSAAAAGGPLGLFAQDLDSGEVTRVPGSWVGGDLSFDGRLVATAGSDGQAVVDLETGRAVRVGPPESLQVGFPAISDDGRYVVAHALTPRGHDLFVTDVATGEVQGSPSGPGTLAGEPEISADGQRIVFVRYHADGLSGDAVLWDRGRGDLRPLTTGEPGLAYSQPTVTDDGTRAVVVTNLVLAGADDDGLFDLYLFDPLP